MRGQSKRLQIFIRVLQNGHPIVDTQWPLSKAAILSLSSSAGTPLALPFYPLAEDIEVLQIKKRRAFLLLNQAWTGQLKSDGELVRLNGKDRSERVLELVAGDFASLALADLQLLIRVGEPARVVAYPLDPHYSGSVWQVGFIYAQEKSAMLGGFLLASVFSLGIASYLKLKESPPPAQFESLEAGYTLPFIAEENLATAPEALQSKLDRYDMVTSVTRYYRNSSQLFMGWPLEDRRYVFSTSLGLYERLYKRYEADIDAAAKAQEEVDAALSLETGSRILAIPSVYGESFQQRVLRLIRKIEVLHQSFNLALEKRRETTAVFNEDPAYDWSQYQNQDNFVAHVQKGAKKELNKIAQISVFKQDTNEEAMYKAAQFLGQHAKLLHQYLQLKAQRKVLLNERTLSPIYLPPAVSFASFVQHPYAASRSDSVMASIAAMEFGEKRSDLVKEPLIGAVDPRLVTAVIKKHRFQLNLCYELALRRNEGLRGKMQWQWRIDSLGQISALSLLKTSLNDRQMISCVQRKMASWKFPAPKKGSVLIEHTLVFEPQNG